MELFSFIIWLFCYILICITCSQVLLRLLILHTSFSTLGCLDILSPSWAATSAMAIPDVLVPNIDVLLVPKFKFGINRSKVHHGKSASSNLVRLFKYVRIGDLSARTNVCNRFLSMIYDPKLRL